MSDEGMSDDELERWRFGLSVNDPQNRVPITCGSLRRIIARLDAAERERDALLSDAVVEELALTIAGCEFWDEGSTIYPNAYRDTARAALTAAMATARAALTTNHSAPVVEE